MGGDFSESLSHKEKDGGSYRERREMENIRELLSSWTLRNLGLAGQWWTWERGKLVDTIVQERLDKFIASPSWCQMYPEATVEHLLKTILTSHQF